MIDERDTIDVIEKLKAYLFDSDPEAERLKQSLSSSLRLLNSPDLIRQAYLAVQLNIDFLTSAGKRQVHKILSHIKQDARDCDLRAWGCAISDNKITYLRKGLHNLDELIERDVLKKELGSGIQKALSGLKLKKSLDMKSDRIYRFLSILGAPVAVGAPAKYRFLGRLGWFTEKGNGARALEKYHSLCENASRLTGESVQSLDFMFFLFSTPARRQISNSPICLAKPKCDQCALQPYCLHYRYGVKGEKKEETHWAIRLRRPEERPREQLEQSGASHLSDSQILAIILRTGVDKRSAIDLATELLARFKTLRGVAEASLTDLRKTRGVGRVKAIEIHAAHEMGKRCLSNKTHDDRTIILESHEVFRQYRNEVIDLKRESFFLLILNSRNQVMKKIEISRGSLDSSVVHPREVFREAIREAASSVICFHNHPSGDPHPSRADVLITERLKQSGELIGIKVLDHIIIGENSFYSFADQGLLC